MVLRFSPIGVFTALASVSPLCEGMVTQALKFLAEWFMAMAIVDHQSSS
jgi:hypothetical protein